MDNIGKILVTGATGNVGGAVITNLVSMGAEVRALVRDESKAQGLKHAGVEVVVGDLEQPETLDAAFGGVAKVFLLTPVSPNAAAQASNGIAAARRAGKPYIVRMSAVKASHQSPTRINRLHADTEDELKASGLPYTILKPHFFMQNTMMAAESVASGGRVFMPLKNGKLGMIDMRDVAEVAARVLTYEGHRGKTYTLTGPASISFHDVAADLSKALDKEVEYVDVPLEAGRDAMLAMGFPQWVAEGYSEYFKAYSEGYGDLVTGDVEQVIGRAPLSYETFARNFAQVFGSVALQAA